MSDVSTTPPPASSQALREALSDLLRVHAPDAALLTSLGGEVLMIREGGAHAVPGAGGLVPPDAWLDGGEMTWLTHDGALLGLIWTEEARPAPESMTQVMTLLLSAQVDSVSREAEMLVSQLPVATAWLDGHLGFRTVSRTLLDLLGLPEGALSGQVATEVWADRPGLLAALAQAAAGRAAAVPDEQFPRAGAEALWVRGEVRPYFGGGSAGVLLTLQDVSGEHHQAARVRALLDTPGLQVLLGADGRVWQASQGVLDLCGGAAPDGPLWSWPCFAEGQAGRVNALRDLLELAAGQGRAAAELPVWQAGGMAPLSLPFTARRTAVPGMLLLEGQRPVERGAQGAAGLLGQVLAVTEDTTVVVDQAGRVQFISDQAARLLGVESGRLVGLGFTRVLADLGVQVYTPDGQVTPFPDWRAQPLPMDAEVVLGLPAGTARHMQVRLSPVALDGGRLEGRRADTGRTGVLISMRDMTALRHAQAQLRHDARHDALTGLLNRSGLREVVDRFVDGSAPGAAVVIGVVKFGDVVAALGRTAVDHLLIQVAARLNDLQGAAHGYAGRLADDALAVYLPGMSPAQALGRVEELLRPAFRANRRLVPLAFALGGSGLPRPGTPGQDPAGSAVLHEAELAMQYVRRGGVAGAEVFAPFMREELSRSFELEDALTEAVSGEQFHLLYQPVVQLSDGRALGAEALLRWEHPALGELKPGAFLPQVSRAGLVTQVNEWVVRSAIRDRGQVRRALPQRRGAWQVAVNLNLRELQGGAEFQGLLPLLAEEGAPDVEVTSASLMGHPEETRDVLNGLRAFGAKLSVDDFGDSATSLASLTQFPLDAVKLHPTLTARLPEDPRSVSLVQGTVDLAHRLGLRVVAVGVETPGQLKVLRELGCDAAQGFAIAPPLALPELLAWLGRQP